MAAEYYSIVNIDDAISLVYLVSSAHRFEWDWIDTECFINNGLEKLAEWWRDEYIATFGPGCTCTHEARFASSVNFPLIDYVSYLHLAFRNSINGLLCPWE